MRATIYVGSSKSNNADIGRSLGLEGDALDTFCYACYEVGLEVEVDPQTGKAEIMAVDGRVVEPNDLMP
jgi:hypothetical protein